MSLDTNGLRQRRTGVTKIVEDLDIFEKVVDNVKEEKKVSSGLSKWSSFFHFLISVLQNFFESFLKALFQFHLYVSL